MKKHLYRTICMVTSMLFMTACGTKQPVDEVEQNSEVLVETELQEQELEQELEEVYVAAEDDEEVPTVYVEYADTEPYPELAEFLSQYYEVPEEEQTETRYYYNRVDLNDDGVDEIFAIVIGEYTQGEAGDPALILAEENGTFTVLEDFAEIRTPVLISETLVNGWHDIIFQVYGMGIETGYEICHYDMTGGYQTENNEISVEKVSVSGMQILSNNLIDDMDQGNYMTLKSEEQQ